MEPARARSNGGGSIFAPFLSRSTPLVSENFLSSLWRGLDATTVGLERVQATLGLLCAAPAARSLIVVAIRHGTGAGPAANTWVTLIVQPIVGDRFIGDAFPHILLDPTGQGADLHKIKLAIPCHSGNFGPIGALVATNAAHPGMLAFNRLSQHRDFAIETALIWIGLVEWPTVEGLVLGYRKLRLP